MGSRRGQSLVLAGLYMLALTLMVLMTLGIAQRVREKTELNTLADATAYSNAVATARAYNAVSLMNRAAIAHWINLAGVESLISWTGLLFAEDLAVMEALFPNSAFGGGTDAYSPPFVEHLPGYSAGLPCQSVMANALWGPMYDMYWDDLHIDWVQFINDAAAAGSQGRRLQDAIATLKGAQVEVVDAVRGLVGGHAIADEISALAHQPDITPGMPALDATNRNFWLQAPTPGIDDEKMWWAVMDARSPWVKNRHNDPIIKYEQALAKRFNMITSAPYTVKQMMSWNPWATVQINGSVKFNFTSHGHGCFGADFDTCENGPDWTNALAEDEMEATITINISSITVITPPATGGTPSSCPGYQRTATIKNASRVKASDIHHDDDYAYWDFRGYGGTGTTNGVSSPTYAQLDNVAFTKHTMGPCTDDFVKRPCHSVYVSIVSLDQSYPLNGQAKNYAGFSRDHSRHAAKETRDPWDVKFHFALGAGPGSDVDLGGKGADEPAVAVGTGVAYYHRRGHFTEMPNLFNPYWRATLIGAQRGKTGGPGDLPALPGQAGAAWSALLSAGYRGEN